jgi:hypothetical protein
VLDAGAVFSLSFPPTALATDLSKEDRVLEDDEAFCCSDPEVATAATCFAVLEGEGFSLIFNGPRNSQLPLKLVKEQGILQVLDVDSQACNRKEGARVRCTGVRVPGPGGGAPLAKRLDNYYRVLVRAGTIHHWTLPCVVCALGAARPSPSHRPPCARTRRMRLQQGALQRLHLKARFRYENA